MKRTSIQGDEKESPAECIGLRARKRVESRRIRVGVAGPPGRCARNAVHPAEVGSHWLYPRTQGVCSAWPKAKPPASARETCDGRVGTDAAATHIDRLGEEAPRPGHRPHGSQPCDGVWLFDRASLPRSPRTQADYSGKAPGLDRPFIGPKSFCEFLRLDSAWSAERHLVRAMELPVRCSSRHSS
jgi:hypothetical protein